VIRRDQLSGGTISGEPAVRGRRGHEVGRRHPLNVVVIGAGVGGLAAALELTKAGHKVSLFEAGPVLGGQVRTFEVGGGRIESFYHHLFRSDTDAIELIEQLGLGDDLEWIDSTVALQVGERRYPFVSALDLLRFGAVSLLTRVRLGLAALWLRRLKAWQRYEGQRASDWIRSRTGREGYERVWGPLLRAKFGDHAEEVSMVWFWGKVHLRFASRPGGPLAREQLGYLRGSFGRLVDAMVEAVQATGATAEVASPVRRVLVEDGRVTGVAVGFGVPGGGEDDGPERIVPCDAVIATIPSDAFRRMVPDLEAGYAALLEGVQYQWATVLALALARPLSETYWLTLTDDDCPFVVAVEQTNFVSPQRYGGQHIVYLSNYCDPGAPIIEEEAEQTLERYLPYIRRINPDFNRSWVRGVWLFRDRAGQPIVHERYHETIAPHRTPIEGLYLANTTQIYPEDRGQNYSIRMGRRVARLALADAADGAGQADAADTASAGTR
jgi:protoporphyrinogen oxidase